MGRWRSQGVFEFPNCMGGFIVLIFLLFAAFVCRLSFLFCFLLCFVRFSFCYIPYYFHEINDDGELGAVLLAARLSQGGLECPIACLLAC